MKKGKIVKCGYCKKEIYIKPSRLKKHKIHYCSYSCINKKKNSKKELECKQCGKKYEVYKSYLKIRKSSFCSRECQYFYISINYKGENNPSWRGGISTESHRLRNSKKWKLWRKEVFERDNYTCQKCKKRNGNGENVILHPHHIKYFSKFPELRFEVSNGQTLCVQCHKEIHSK